MTSIDAIWCKESKSSLSLQEKKTFSYFRTNILHPSEQIHTQTHINKTQNPIQTTSFFTMDVLRHVILLFSLFVVISNALRCTVNCNYKFPISKPFYIPDSCNEMISAGQCKVEIEVGHHTEEVSVTFSSDKSNYIMNGRAFLYITLDYPSLSLSNTHQCKNTDDCAREFARIHAPVYLARPIVDYRLLLTELRPLLLSKAPFDDHSDLLCFDTNENIRQCALGTAPGECEVNEYLHDKKKTTRTCEREAAVSKKFVSIYDSGEFAIFTVHGNRSLCNGALTTETVKNILFKYNITVSQNGRLNNRARQLSISSIVILISFSFSLGK